MNIVFGVIKFLRLLQVTYHYSKRGYPFIAEVDWPKFTRYDAAAKCLSIAAIVAGIMLILLNVSIYMTCGYWWLKDV